MEGMGMIKGHGGGRSLEGRWKLGRDKAIDEVSGKDGVEAIVEVGEAQRVNRLNEAQMIAHGMHMPLGKLMDMKALGELKKYGPPLALNNIAYETITRRDICIDYEDVLGDKMKIYDECARERLSRKYGVEGGMWE